jgi:hypothetical protein
MCDDCRDERRRESLRRSSAKQASLKRKKRTGQEVFTRAYRRFRHVESGVAGHVIRSVREACQNCPMHSAESNTICNDCPMVDFVRIWTKRTE